MPLDVSVIIPSLDSPVVDRAVEAVHAQVGGPPVEILVVGSDRPGRLGGDSRATVVAPHEALLPGAARNLGAARARGAVLAFLDADCVPEPGWLVAHVARQAQGSQVVGGPVRIDRAPYWSMVDNLSSFHECLPGTPTGRRPYLPTLNLSVAAATYAQVGPMDEGLPRGEDLDWTIRAAEAGHAPYFEPAARVWHRPVARGTPAAVLARWVDKGRWMARVRRRHEALFGAAPWLDHPRLLRLASPAIAAAATWRVFAPGRPGRRYPSALPAVYLTKIAWCWGAARPAPLTGGAPPLPGAHATGVATC